MRIEHQQYPFSPKPYEEDNSNPFYRYDPDQCILCGRCVESMIDLTKQTEPGYGAIFTISDVEANLRAERIQKTKTVCTYCGVGCSFDVWTKGRKVLKIEPQMEAPANQISTCVKGKFGWDFVNSADRLLQPLIRKGDTFHSVSWEEALNYIAQRLTDIRTAMGRTPSDTSPLPSLQMKKITSCRNLPAP